MTLANVAWAAEKSFSTRLMANATPQEISPEKFTERRRVLRTTPARQLARKTAKRIVLQLRHSHASLAQVLALSSLHACRP